MLRGNSEDRKNKSESKKELEESIINGKENENTDIQEKVNNLATNEDAAKLLQEVEKIINSKKSDIVWLAYHQGQKFQRSKERERFVSMV